VKQHILITGGAGFLGQHLIYRLLQSPEALRPLSIRVIDLHPPAYPVFGKLLEDPLLSYHFDIDITQADAVKPFFESVDTVFHLAGLVSFSRLHKALLYQVNTEGTRHVAEAAAQAGAKNVIHISSVAAIGYPSEMGALDSAIDESFSFDWESARAEDLKHYMLSKKAAEDLLVDYVSRYPETRWLIANPALMFGPGDVNNTRKLIQGIRSGHFPSQPPGGTYVVDVRDVVQGLLALLDKGRSGERYIIGGFNLKFTDMNAITASAVNAFPPPTVLPYRSKAILCKLFALWEQTSSQPVSISADNIEAGFRCRYFQSQKARDELGWQVNIPFRQSIADAYHWLQERDLVS
jgi:dihydroflavonol-4-reductase